MVSPLKFVILGFSILALLGWLLGYYIKMRKEETIVKGVMWGVLSYFLMNIIFAVAQIPFGDITKMTFGPQYGMIWGIMSAVAFTLASIIVVPIAYKKFKFTKWTTTHLSFGLMIFFVASTLSTLTNIFMFGFAINKGTAATVLNPSFTPEQVANLVNEVVNNPNFYYANILLSRIYEYIIYTAGFALIIRGVREDKLLSNAAIALVLVFINVAITGLLFNLNMPILTEILRFAFAAFVGFKLYQELFTKKA